MTSTAVCVFNFFFAWTDWRVTNYGLVLYCIDACCSGHAHWLQWDRRVLEHEFPRRTGPLLLYFAVR